MKFQWTFSVGGYHWSFDRFVFNAQTYEDQVIPESFSGINLRRNLGSDLISSNDCDFEVVDKGAVLSAVNFDGQDCIIRLIKDGAQLRAWKMKVKRTSAYYQKVKFYCVDLLQAVLDGDWPNTPDPRDLYPSEDVNPYDSYCVPVVLGDAYIPLRSVNTGTERHYILGPAGPTYSITEVCSPHDWDNQSTWDSATYTFSQSDQGDYRAVQPMIHDLNGDGSEYAAGLWRSGGTFLDMLCKFSRSDTVDIDTPGEWISYILQAFGVDSGDISATTWATWSTTFEGGFWEKESRETLLANLLAQCDSFVTHGEGLELRPFSSTSIETFTDVLKGSWSPSILTKHESDGGTVKWQNAGAPQDKLTGQALVGSASGQGSVSNPAGEFEARFISDSQDAQTAAILYFQKKYRQINRASWALAGPTIDSLGWISPGHVAAIVNDNYGGPGKWVITSMNIARDLRVNFEGVGLSFLEDWDDIAPTAVPIGSGAATVFPQPYVEALGNYVEKVSYNADIATIQNQIDKSITTWFYDGEPTLINSPASDWVTTDDKNIHLGDLYYDNLTGFCYRFRLDNSTYSWLRLTDSDITEALAAASQAQDTADSKRRVFYDTPVVPYDAGDLWDTGNGLKRSTVDQTVAYNAGDWVLVADPAGSNVSKAAAGGMAYVDLVSLAKLDDSILDGGFFKASLINTSVMVIGDMDGGQPLIDSVDKLTYLVFDGNFENATESWSETRSGENPPPINKANLSIISGGTNGGNILQWVSGAPADIYSRKAIPIDTSDTYRIKFRVRQSVNATDPTKQRVYVGIQCLDGSYNNVGLVYVINQLLTDNDWHSYIAEISDSGTYQWPAGTVYARVRLLANYQLGDGTAEIDYITVENVTAATQAESNANAHTEGWSEQGADVTANNTAANTAAVAGTAASTVEFNAAKGLYVYNNAGDMAWEDMVSYAMLDSTIVVGGYIKTTLLDVDAILFDDDLGGVMSFSTSGKITFGYLQNSIFGNDYQMILNNNNEAIITIQKDVGGIGSLVNIYSGENVEIDASTNIDLDASNDVYLRSGSYDLGFNNLGQLVPLDTGMQNGTSGNPWNKIYGNDLYNSSGLLQDKQDDLAVLSQFQPKKKKILDFESDAISEGEVKIHDASGLEYMDICLLPRWMTNYYLLREEIRSENGDLISDADFDLLIQDDDELGYRLYVNDRHYVGLISGGVRQLDTEVIGMFELQAGRITDQDGDITWAVEQIECLRNRVAVLENSNQKIGEAA